MTVMLCTNVGISIKIYKRTPPVGAQASMKQSHESFYMQTPVPWLSQYHYEKQKSEQSLTGPGCSLKLARAPVDKSDISFPVIGGLSINDCRELKNKQEAHKFFMLKFVIKDIFLSHCHQNKKIHRYDDFFFI